VGRQQVPSEIDVLLGHHGPQLLGQLGRIGLPHALVLARDHHIDAVGPVADVLVDPGQLDLQLLGREPHGTEHAETTRLAHGRDHVPAMGESKDRKLDTKLVTKRRVHG
jgi:hypothetical protein